MPVIAFVGVSGSGKSTLIYDLNIRLNKTAVILDEPANGEVLRYAGLPLTYNSKTDPPARIARYDYARVEYQMLIETKAALESSSLLLVDKSTACSLVYALTMSARFAGDNLYRLVKEFQEHCAKTYDLVVYTPYRHFDTSSDNLERRVTNKYVLEAQDSVIRSILTWIPGKIYTASMGRRSNAKALVQYLISIGILQKENVYDYHI